MKLTNSEYSPPMNGNLPLSPLKRPSGSTPIFSAMVDAEVLKAEVAANRAEVLASQQLPPEPMAKEAVAFIREHGMSAYVEKVHVEKIAEMREKILARMGLSEEALSEMPAGQRSVIEQMISNEIQKQLEANSLMNKDNANDNGSYLKTMMMINGSGGFFGGQSASLAPNFKEHVARFGDKDPAYAFFRSKQEEK